MVHDPKNERMGFADINYFGNSTQFGPPPPPPESTVATSSADAATEVGETSTTPAESLTATSATLEPHQTEDHFLSLDIEDIERSGANSKQDLSFVLISIILVVLTI
jgi:hypothetical protein